MNEYKICNRCIMDISDPDIQFNDDGICNHCRRYDYLKNYRINIGSKAEEIFEDLVNRIKTNGKNNKYDCLIGVSGGVDSTFAAHLLVTKGIRPLAVHFDNGWNSELAVANIEKIIDKLNIDLYTYVMNWEAFKNCQIAFLKSATPDGEIPTDHAINAVLFKIASKHKIKYIINGMNFNTEGMAVPAWSYGHSDWLYINTIYKQFGVNKNYIKQYPHFSLKILFYYLFLKRIKVVSILNYINYNKEESIDIIKKDLDWNPYPQKHYESVYTRFFQGYYLPTKFSIDKRRGHYSDLIRSQQMDRNNALQMIKKPPYSSILKMNDDINFVIKKLGFQKSEFEKIMKNPNCSHSDFKNQEHRINKYKTLYNKLRKKGYFSK